MAEVTRLAPATRSGTIREKVIEAYLRLGSVAKVSKALGLSRSKVVKVLREVCGPIYGLKGVCRLYLLMSDRCLITAPEARRLLGRTKQDIYYLFRELAERVPVFKVTLATFGDAKILILYKDTETCREELSRFIAEHR